MPDQEQSTAAPPRPDPRHPSTWPEVSERDHPLREVFLAQVHPDYHGVLAGPFELLWDVLMALGGPDAAAYRGVRGLHGEVSAAARDLRFTAAHLRGGIVGNWQGGSLSFEEESLCRFAADFSFRLDALTAELETYLANWQPEPES